MPATAASGAAGATTGNRLRERQRVAASARGQVLDAEDERRHASHRPGSMTLRQRRSAPVPRSRPAPSIGSVGASPRRAARARTRRRRRCAARSRADLRRAASSRARSWAPIAPAPLGLDELEIGVREPEQRVRGALARMLAAPRRRATEQLRVGVAAASRSRDRDDHVVERDERAGGTRFGRPRRLASKASRTRRRSSASSRKSSAVIASALAPSSAARSPARRARVLGELRVVDRAVDRRGGDHRVDRRHAMRRRCPCRWCRARSRAACRTGRRCGRATRRCAGSARRAASAVRSSR